MSVHEGVPARDFFCGTVAALPSVLRFTAIAMPASASRSGGPWMAYKIKWVSGLLACGDDWRAIGAFLLRMPL